MGYWQPAGKQVQIGLVVTFWYELMSSQDRNFNRKSAPERSARMVETIFGCKWSLTVYRLLANGINRPGEMVRHVDGLTTKVLNECLRRNMGFGILQRIAYNEVPPHVEYVVTPFGEHFIHILDEIEKLQGEMPGEN